MNPHVSRFQFSEAMEPNLGDPFDSSSSSSSSTPSGDEEAVNDLLEECWFFDNLFQRKTRMLRCYSDPCCPPSSKEIFTKNSDGQNITKNKITAGDEDGVVQSHLIRAPSLLPCVGRNMEENHQEKESNKSLTRQSSLPKPASGGKKEATKGKESTAIRSKSNNGQFLRSNLHRTPSLPSYFGREEDTESDARMSNLIHQAFSTSSDILPKSQTSKGLTRSYSISRYRPPRSSEVERHYNYNMNGSIKDMNRRCLINQSKSRKKSTSDLESEEVQGFKDLGFTFEKQELSPSVVNILPGLQEKNNNNNSREVKLRRPYLSEAWLSNNFAPPPPPPPPPVPNWATKNSAQDIKAQIKFWARAVASNVHQEC